MPQTSYTWANDPAAFPNYPEFFLAHEIAHQWWGQAIGWRSYHEQWISEGFAQYFAALYAHRRGGPQAFDDVMRRMARFARDQSSQGPISLGYRLGHVRNDMRVFRALVYNKSAVVLHNLRLLLGDEAFFRSIRRFYYDWRFRKAGTDDVRRAFEQESGQDLSRYFEGWIHSSRIPALRFSWQRQDGPEGPVAVIRLEPSGTPFDVAVPVTLRFADRTTRDVIVSVTGGPAEVRVPFTGDLRDVTANDAGLALVDVVRN
jgi:aminopeptidase N